MIKITMSNMVIYIAQKDKKCVHYESLIFLGMIATIVASLLYCFSGCKFKSIAYLIVTF